MPYGEYAEALMVATAAKEAFQDCVLEFDAILTPSAPGEAPKGLESTGDPLFNKAWTTIGAPCITLPVGTGPAGLPLGVQLVASVGADLDLLTTAKWVEQHLR
jgi:Asp-tRNA(Asn)/Glu-tRNA(Gln) amidotransferase A subunit family amidase